MTWSADDQQRLATLADLLIPAGDDLPSGGDLPSASHAGVSGEALDRILTGRDQLATHLRNAITHAGNPVTVAELVAALDEAEFLALTTVVAGGYFLNPEVRKGIGYAGLRAIPVSADEATDELLGPVRDRGPIFREV